MEYGYSGKMGFVNLETGEIKEEKLDKSLAHEFVGGYGLGVRVIFERQKAKVDSLGPENILGFTTGPLTGTSVPTGNRYMVACKSPLTGCWGDANSGGYFGSELKAAGWDAIFVSGIAARPKYLFVTDRIELRDGSALWGKDTVDTEGDLIKELGDSKIRVACIGPAGERLSLISGVVNDKGRIAARSGVGAVMGSKRLKAVAVRGKRKVSVANSEKFDQLRRSFIKKLRESPSSFAKSMMEYGTYGLMGGLIMAGGTPIKNWLLAGKEAFPTVENVSKADNLIKYQVRRYGCANCPIACGGIVRVTGGSFPVTEVHKPEYETLAAFGPLCLNDNLNSIIKLTDMCNRSGLDTISTGHVLAFAMECYDKGIINKSETDGLELAWGNPEAMISLVDKISRREGFGDVLADGVRVAAKKIGRGADQCAVHVCGQEPGFHSPIYIPSRGAGYVCDPTPGRHTSAAPLSRVDLNAVVAPYPELHFSNFERYEYEKKGPASATASCYWQAASCAGLCLFPVLYFGDFPTLDFFNAVTGWDIDMSEFLKDGARIQTLRQCFNVREGITVSDTKLPGRMVGIPPHSEGPLRGITVDTESLSRAYRQAMGWNPEDGHPYEQTLGKLGLKGLVGKHQDQ